MEPPQILIHHAKGETELSFCSLYRKQYYKTLSCEEMIKEYVGKKITRKNYSGILGK